MPTKLARLWADLSWTYSARVFGYHPSITAAYPTIRAGILKATGLVNGPASPTLTAEYRLAQIETAHRLAETDIADIPPIGSWRRAFTRFGAKPTQHRSAVEALLRRLSKQGDIPTISALVDIGNLVSIRYAMPVAVIDSSTIDTQITVRFATGSESFTELGSEAAVHPEPGEVIFIDAGDQVSARRWCWRQSAGSATGTATTEALFVIEGHHEQASADIDRALADLEDLLARHQPASQFKTWKLPKTE